MKRPTEEQVKKFAWNTAVLLLTFGLQGVGFLMLALQGVGDLSGWIAQPVGWFCLILSLLIVQFVVD